MIYRQTILRGAMVMMLAGMAGRISARPKAGSNSLSNAAIARNFEVRRQAILDAAVATVHPESPAKGGLLQVAACLAEGKRVPEALARLAQINKPMPTGAMFWMYQMVTVMEAGRDHLDAASWHRIRELWKQYWPARGDTENHWAMYYSSLYLAAQTWPHAGRDQWYNGESSAENMAEARSYLLNWMRITTSYGQGEYDSPNYIEEYIIPMSLLAGWAKDPVLRQKARMMLDYIIYDYVVENVQGYYGGAHSRIYPRQVVAPGWTPIGALSWLLFGFHKYQSSGSGIVLALSGYRPPPILERIARDVAHRPYVERELKRTRWRMRHAGPHSFVVGDERTVPVYKYSYVDKDFVLGSSQGGLLQPIQQQTWSLIWRSDKPVKKAANTFFALQPYSSPFEGTMYFGMAWDVSTDFIARSKIDYDSPDKLESGSPYEQVFQHGTALIGLYDMPADNRFPEVTAFFSRDLTGTVVDPSGWIFARGGPVYIAYRPFASGVWKPNDWTGLLYRDAKSKDFIGNNFPEWGAGHKCYVSTALKNGYVVQVAPVRDYASFDAFKTAVRALPLKFSTKPVPEATFTALDGSVLHARYDDPPTVNGRTVDYAHWPLFDSPFAHEVRGSQRLGLHDDGEELLLNFKKTVIKETAQR